MGLFLKVGLVVMKKYCYLDIRNAVFMILCRSSYFMVSTGKSKEVCSDISDYL